MNNHDPRLLIVDDTPANLDALEVLLAPTGCAIVRAQSAEEALLALLQDDFAAIILDIRMPGMDGFDLARLIKQRRRSRDTPILFLTAHLIERADLLAGYGLGAVDYLSKPIHPEILRSKVSVFIELYRKTRALADLNQALEREVAERTRAQREVEQANNALEERVRERTAALSDARRVADSANKAKDQFLAMLGHELRNPLAPMVTALDLLRLRGQHSAEQDVLERQVRQLVRMVDDLLDVSRITTGKVELRRRQVEAAVVVSRAMEVAGPLLERRRHVVQIAVAREGLPLHADVDRLAQVIANLLINAAKYSEPGSSIILHGTRVNDLVRLSIQDEGIGIPPEMLHGVFEAFVQQPQAIDRSRGGLGLGLAIARSLTIQHGGTIRAESQGPGQGSTFFVDLPAAEGEASADRTAIPSLASDRARACALRILVVDDNQDAASMLETALRQLGFVVEAAHDGPSALRCAARVRPDVALLDLGLPIMDGYELAQRLRASPGGSELRLIAVTGYGQEADRERAYHAGFDSHFVKPIDLSELWRLLIEPVDAPAPPLERPAL